MHSRRVGLQSAGRSCSESLGDWDFKSQISNLKSQISNLKSQISNLKSQISNLKSQISNFKFQISNLKSQISTLKSKISNDVAVSDLSRPLMLSPPLVATFHMRYVPSTEREGSRMLMRISCLSPLRMPVKSGPTLPPLPS